MSSLAPCLPEEAEPRMFAHATEATKRANEKISSHTVDTGLVVLVIPIMVQQLGVDDLWGWQKSLAIVGMKSNCVAFFHSLIGCN